MAKRTLSDRVKKDTPKKLTVEQQEQAILAIDKKEGSGVKKKKTARVTVDFPVELYEQMKEDTKENGQTLRGFIVSLVKRHYKEKQA